MTTCEEGISDMTEALDLKVEEIIGEIRILKCAVAAGLGEGFSRSKLEFLNRSILKVISV